MKNKLQIIFNKPKPIIGMLHFGYLLGSKSYPGINNLLKAALKDAKALRDGGIDGILIENWKEDSIGEFVAQETTANFAVIAYELAKYIEIPFGINVLNNDYKSALAIAKLAGAKFVQLDVFVDHVISNFKYSPAASKNPFEINPNPAEIQKYAKKIDAEDIPLFVFVQPKHYKLVNPHRTIEQSTIEAVKAGASALLVTKETGSAPTKDLILRAKATANNVPVGIGSGFSKDNASEFLPIIDFAVVGTAIKVDGITDNPIDVEKVKELMAIANKYD